MMRPTQFAIPFDQMFNIFTTKQLQKQLIISGICQLYFFFFYNARKRLSLFLSLVSTLVFSTSLCLDVCVSLHYLRRRFPSIASSAMLESLHESKSSPTWRTTGYIWHPLIKSLPNSSVNETDDKPHELWQLKISAFPNSTAHSL